jgi:acetyl/propionyl-CoA carboxylase alpha subunit
MERFVGMEGGGSMSADRLTSGGQSREVRLEGATARLDGRSVAFEILGGGFRGGSPVEIVVGGRTHRVLALRDGARVFVWVDGQTFIFERAERRRTRAASEQAGDLLAPMPGRVRKTLVSIGDSVRKGQPLLVLEAMKMEHSIRAPRDGAVRRLLVREGDLVDAGVELAEISS